MVHFFCPGCWEDFSEDFVFCPACGLNIHAFWDSLDRVEKLVLALHHPEPSTPVRAAWLLGKTEDPRALKALTELLQETRDVYLALAAVRALGDSRAPEAIAFLKTLRTHPAATIRRAVERVLVEAERVAAVNEPQLKKEAV